MTADYRKGWIPMAIEWTEEPRGIIVPLHVQPGGRKNEIRGEQAGALKLSVTAKPENGKANEAVIELLSKIWRLRKSQIHILSGDTSRQKRILITEVCSDEFSAKLQACLDHAK
jgi:uncharacterized protein (TIGR00251 family)